MDNAASERKREMIKGRQTDHKKDKIRRKIICQRPWNKEKYRGEKYGKPGIVERHRKKYYIR